MASVHDRKNQLVWESIDAAANKQALQLCNRRIKKGEKGDYLMLLKAHVLTLLPPSAANYDEALGICRSIAERKTPVVDDVDVAMFLQRIWSFLEDRGVGGKGEASRGCAKVWELAVKARVGDERMAKEWVFGCARSGDWRGMQKAAMHLQQQFPKRREYYFWAIMSCLLLHNSLPETSKERKLFGLLAYRMVIKARAEVPPESNNILLPPRALQSAQEVHLLLTVIPSASPAPTPRERAMEALAVLDSKNLGLESAIAKGDYLGLLRRKLGLLREVEKWDSLWEFCGELLRKAREPESGKKEEKSGLPKIGDDWALWDNYLDATDKLLNGTIGEGMDKESLKAETLKTVLGYVEPEEGKKATRNSQLALVKLASLFHSQKGAGAPEGTPSLAEACSRYFEGVGSKNCCFEDLGRYVEMFDEAEQEEFLTYLKKKDNCNEDNITVARIAEQINIQKFVYFIKISTLALTAQGGVEDLTTTLTQFAAANMQIYLSALAPSISSSLIVTDNQYGDDAALLAVMALLRLWKLENEKSDKPLLQAIFILEIVLVKSKHNYQALLLLTRLYLLVGAPYLAASNEVWGRLNVKQIQTDTLGHWLFTRGSTTFPLQLSVKADSSMEADFVNHLSKSLRIYDANRKQTPDMVVLALDRGTYGQITEFVEFGRRLEGSLARGVYEIDKRRSERLRGGAGGENGVSGPWKADMLGVPGTGDVIDNRDFTVLANFERKGPRAEEKFLRIGQELPAVRWARGFSLVEELVGVASGGAKDVKARATEIEKSLATLLSEEAEAQNKEFTPEEKDYLSFGIKLSQFLMEADVAKYTEHIDGIASFFKNSTPALPQPYSWLTLHRTYSRLESALLASTVLTKAVKPQINKLKGPPGQKVKQAFQELVSVSIPGYVKGVKEAFGKNVESRNEGELEKEVLAGGDELAKLLCGNEVFGGEEALGRVLGRLNRGRGEAAEVVRKWVLPGVMG